MVMPNFLILFYLFGVLNSFTDYLTHTNTHKKKLIYVSIVHNMKACTNHICRFESQRRYTTPSSRQTHHKKALVS